MHFNQKKTSIIVLLFVASLLVVSPFQMVKAQTSTTTVTVTPQTSTPVVGQTLTVNITLNNVQNLYGIDVTLNWNPSLLSFQTNSNQTFIGYSYGVLNNPTSLVLDSASQATGEFHLVVTSVSPATAFSGSGTIATLMFTVTGAGQSSLTVASTLANYPAAGESSEPIAHNDISGTVDATTSSSSPPTSPTPMSSSSSSPSPTSSSSPPSSASPSVSFLGSTTFLELLAIIVIVVIVLVSAAVLLSRKMMKKTAPASS